MLSLILLTTVILTLPSYNEDNTPIPDDEYLIATVWRVGSTVPIGVQLGLPGEQILVDTLQAYGTWYASVFDLNGNESMDAEHVSKIAAATCGGYCHQL